MAAEREKLERKVLEVMAQGLSNKGICEKLVVSPKTVETHVNSIFWKLGLLPAQDEHLRVLAVLVLRGQEAELPEDGVHVRLDGLGADDELLEDALVREALRHQLELDLGLGVLAAGCSGAEAVRC